MNLRDIRFVPADNRGDSRFVGIKIVQNEIEFHYPITFELSENEKDLRKDIVSIIRSIELAKTLTRDKSSYNRQFKKEYIFPIKAFIWIINDFLTYGRYINLEKKYQEGTRGKINWKKTMKNDPAISQGNVVYSKIISEKKDQIDNLLSEIYFYCVQKAVDSIGWLYNISFDNKGINYYKLFNKKKYINAINDELSKSFDDNKKIRLSNMKNVILGLDEDIYSTKELIYGVDSYEDVFEKMIDMMFSKVDKKKDFYPSAFWDLLYPTIRDNVESTNLRPDTISIDKRIKEEKPKVFILDAKYYHYGLTFNPNDLPETTSIQKQITYGEYIKKVKDGEYSDVFSAFIMPYNKYNNPNLDKLNKDIEFIGIAKAKWIDSNENDRIIAGILIDTRFLVENWIARNDANLFSLLDLIETKVNGATK